MRDRFKDLQRSGRWRAAGIVSLIGLAAAAASADAAVKHRSAEGAAPTTLHVRALAALPAARKAFDSQLVDYPSARFQDVHARIVRSVYYDDEGQSDKVPWTHRGGPVLVLCDQVNAKNHMSGYTGWKSFAFEPAQTDIVTMYGHQTPTPIASSGNIATSDELTFEHDDVVDDDKVRLLCEADPVETDAADLAGALPAGEHEARR